ncbi:hypothetical protein PG995_003701 [Apiospora arundinis]
MQMLTTIIPLLFAQEILQAQAILATSMNNTNPDNVHMVVIARAASTTSYGFSPLGFVTAVDVVDTEI